MASGDIELRELSRVEPVSLEGVDVAPLWPLEVVNLPAPEQVSITKAAPCPRWRAPRPLTVMRYAGESDSFALLDCDGAVSADALDRLSVLARPPAVPRPELPLPSSPKRETNGCPRCGCSIRDSSGWCSSSVRRFLAGDRDLQRLPSRRAQRFSPEGARARPSGVRGPERTGVRLLQEPARRRLRLLPREQVRPRRCAPLRDEPRALGRCLRPWHAVTLRRRRRACSNRASPGSGAPVTRRAAATRRDERFGAGPGGGPEVWGGGGGGGGGRGGGRRRANVGAQRGWGPEPIYWAGRGPAESAGRAGGGGGAEGGGKRGGGDRGGGALPPKNKKLAPSAAQRRLTPARAYLAAFEPEALHAAPLLLDGIERLGAAHGREARAVARAHEGALVRRGFATLLGGVAYGRPRARSCT